MKVSHFRCDGPSDHVERTREGARAQHVDYKFSVGLNVWSQNVDPRLLSNTIVPRSWCWSKLTVGCNRFRVTLQITLVFSQVMSLENVQIWELT